MCGRYYIDDTVENEIERIVGKIDKNLSMHKTGDIHPAEFAPVICQKSNNLYAVDMQWGFEGKDKKLLINARAETALEKATFSDSILHRRCVIPAGCFYEWNRDRQKVTFRYPADPMIYLAGFYRMYGNEPHFIIVTTDANASMSPVHDRMPLILEEREITSWICEDAKVGEFLKKSSPMLERQQDYEQMSLF